MSGRIEVLKGVVNDTGKKFYRDKSINKGTRSVFDMAVTTMGGGKDLAAGATIHDLTYNDHTGAFSLAKSFNAVNNGMVFAGVKNDGFDLDAASCMKVTDTHWLFTAWLKVSKAGSVSTFNNQLLHFSAAEVNGAANALLSIVPTTDVAGQPTKIELAVRGKNYVPTANLLPLFDGNRHQFAVECEFSADGTQHTIRAYIDKVVVFTSTSALAVTPPGEPTTRRIGTSNPFPLSWTGMLYRARVDDVGTSGLTATDILTADYNLCASRFS
ncbi:MULTISPECIES: hypothetical protein [Klebsiella pneumoniae complex]|uniref:hypothetical protein n=1 Tax=Klebsiella pneumoniae complex TaxID=3390273 RepID=UPI000E1FE548|nr:MULTISPECIES: hypothetical protein [Klebsiella]MCI8021330.1 hypothetical protein [Klebsiella pneumoniae]HCB2067997.1 hypothetical protein [Klebsiella pneumoniae]